MVFGTYKLSEMAFAIASSVVPERPANGGQGQEPEADVSGVIEYEGKIVGFPSVLQVCVMSRINSNLTERYGILNSLMLRKINI